MRVLIGQKSQAHLIYYSEHSAYGLGTKTRRLCNAVVGLIGLGMEKI